MNHTPSPFDADEATLPDRIVTGLAKIGLALKSQAWQEASGRGLTPVQGQVLVLLRANAQGLRLSAIAEALGVRLPTASDTVSALVDKGLVLKERSAEDARALAVVLTPAGRHEAEQASSWPDFLLEGIAVLSPQEQEVFLRGLIKMIRSLQEKGRIPVQRMCVSCRYFQPNAYADPERPHHCALVNAPFGDRHLRLDCPEQEPAEAAQADKSWQVFLSGRTPAV
jgi:DNA-binding MarR family transcriptional regulator